jgi:hypothetical protein
VTADPYSSLGPVQAAIYTALTADAALTAVATIWDEVPEGTAMPYVQIGEAIETPDDWHGGIGRQTVATLHVWSRARGFAQVVQIMDRVVALLDHRPLTVPGRHFVASRFEFAQTLRDTDPGIRHGVVRFRILTEQE